MAWIAAAVGVGGSLLGGMSANKAAKKAAAAQEAGVKRVEDNTGFKSTYSPGGQQAFTQSQNLLGVGDGSPEAQAAAQQGFQNYLGSAGYQTQLKGGIDALNSNAAAKGMLKSGATLKATQRFGSGLGQQYFNNYIGQLMGQTDVGMRADQTLANVYTGGAAGQASAHMAAGDATSKAYAGAASNIAGAIGDMRGKTPTTQTGVTATTGVGVPVKPGG